MSEEGMIDAGDLRPSNLLSYSGPGSIVNTKYDAIMIYGCNFWPQKLDTKKKKYKILHHELLQKKLKLTHIRMPLSHERGFNIPVFSFPTWSVCENCNRLQIHDETPDLLSGHFEGYPCWYCKDHGIDPNDCRLIHARFAVICEKGHIDEFPWDKWAHQKKPNMECDQNHKKDQPWLEFTEAQNSSGLKDYWVTCKKCGARKNCGGATDPSPFIKLNVTCSGRSPWLNKTELCTDENGKETIVRGIQIRANSIWYSVTMSALKVPKWLHPVNRKLDEERDANRLRGAIELDMQDGKSFEEIYDYHAGKFREVRKQILEQKTKYADPNCSDQQIKDEIIKKLEDIFDEKPVTTEIPHQLDILRQEYDDFVKTESTKGENYEDEFELETSEINEDQKLLSKYFKNLKQINKISTISVLTGFTRGSPPDIFDPDEDRICQITTDRHRRTDKWLTGIIDKGEGIFFSLNNEMLSKWENNNELRQRCEVIIESYAQHAAPKDEKKQKEIISRFNPRFILLHTLSHLLIKSLAKYAGYGEPSIRERIYWDNKDRNGILLYTSGSSEGSLGGLVRLGKSIEFEKRLEDALELSLTCSRDPVCEESNPISMRHLSKTHQLSGSSCHSCCIVAETSCQFFNQFLDRWTIKDKSAGFFKDYLNDQAN